MTCGSRRRQGVGKTQGPAGSSPGKWLLLSWGGSVISRGMSKVTGHRAGGENFPTRVCRHTYTHAHSRHTPVLLGWHR